MESTIKGRAAYSLSHYFNIVFQSWSAALSRAKIGMKSSYESRCLQNRDLATTHPLYGGREGGSVGHTSCIKAILVSFLSSLPPSVAVAAKGASSSIPFRCWGAYLYDVRSGFGEPKKQTIVTRLRLFCTRCEKGDGVKMFEIFT